MNFITTHLFQRTLLFQSAKLDYRLQKKKNPPQPERKCSVRCLLSIVFSTYYIVPVNYPPEKRGTASLCQVLLLWFVYHLGFYRVGLPARYFSSSKFRVVFLLDRLPTKAREPGLPYPQLRGEERWIRTFTRRICAKSNVMNRKGN